MNLSHPGTIVALEDFLEHVRMVSGHYGDGGGTWTER